MNEVIEFLKQNPVQYVATIGLDHKPKVRPFQFMFSEDGKLFFCTNNQKDVYAEMKNNPYIEITTSSPQFAWLRLNGKVTFVDDLRLKQKAIDASNLVESIYQMPDNPIFEVFYLDEAKAILADFSGNAPCEYLL